MAGTDQHGIEHVIVLMLENRSYDHLLGFVDIPGSDARPGLDEHGDPLGCPVRNESGVRVVRSAPGVHYAAPLDPDHSHAAAMQQLGASRRSPHQPNNRGFVESYLAKADGTSPELRDRIKERLWALALVTFIAAVLQCARPLVAFVWLLFVLLVVAGAWFLVWRGTALTGYVPRTLLALIYGKTRSLPVRVGLAVAVLGLIALAVLPWFGGTTVVVIDALVLALAGVGVLFGANKVGKHTTVPHAGDVLDRAVVNAMSPAAIQPLAQLATSFATCTRWFSSVPGETWPNRNFVHAGTSDGATDIEYRLFEDDTIFDRLESAGRPWAVYFRGVPQVMAFPSLWTELRPGGRMKPIDELWNELGPGGTLPAYTFIEPFHGTKFSDPPFDATPGTTDSQHSGNNRIPAGQYDDATQQESFGHDFVEGMHLIAEVYERLRTNADLFAKTVLVITYDEHGGLYDHFPPPADATPTRARGFGKRLGYRLLEAYGMRARSYDFSMLGPRVPAIIVSPRVPARAVDRVFDHTSIPRTVRRLFGLDEQLTDREAAANPFDDLVSLEAPRSDLPDLGAWASEDPAAARDQRARERADAAAPASTGDGLTRSLDLVLQTFLQYLDSVPPDLPSMDPERRRAAEAKVRRRAMRQVRRETLRALGEEAANRPEASAPAAPA